MKKLCSLLLITLASGLMFLSSCNRDKDDSEQSENASDASRVQAESEEIVKEVNDALTGNTNTRNRTSAGPFCNVTIDSTNAATGLLILTFNGQNCTATRTRTGTVTVQLSSPYNWSAMGSVATVTINNFRITRLSDNKAITINGTKTITNANGGRIVDLAVGVGSVIHTIASSNMSVQFDDGTTRTWSIARNRTVTLETNGYHVKVEGTANQGGHSQVAEWGVNRRGNTFYSTISVPVVWRIDDCPRGPISGQRILYGTVYTLNIDFGVNQDGTSYGGSGCPYGLKLSWTGRRGKTREAVLAY